MTTPQPLRWNDGEKQRRAPQFPQTTWDAHRSRIEGLYRDRTLAEVAEIMKTQYGFVPTLRQYTHQLKKWGVHKQVAGKHPENNPIPASTDPPTSCSEDYDELSPFSSDQRPENQKRPHSRQSHEAQSSQRSQDLELTNKRLKTTSEESTNDVSSFSGDSSVDESSSGEGSSGESSFGESSLVPSHSTATEDSQSIVSSVSSAEVSIAKCNSPDESGTLSSIGRTSSSEQASDVDASEVLAHEIFQTPSLPLVAATRPKDSSHLEMEPPRRSRLQEYVDQLMASSQEQSLSPEHLSRPGGNGFAPVSTNLDFCLKTSQDLEGFLNLSKDFDLPEHTKEKLKVVADRLFAADRLQAASNIYSVLLVAEQSKTQRRTRSHPHGTPMITPLLLAAFRSVKTVPQCILVRDILLKRMSLDRKKHDPGSAAERFLAHYFMADCYSRLGNTPDRFYHMRQSWVFAHRVNQEGDPWLTPGLEVIFYLCYKRAFPEIPSSKFLKLTENLKAIAGSSHTERLAAHGTTPIAHDDFMQFCTRMKDSEQGEEADQQFETSLEHCIPACVRDYVAWCGSKIKDRHLEPLPFDRFECVWTAWKGSTTLPDSDVCYTMDPESKLGISTAEHLHICAQIFCSIGRDGLESMSDQKLVDLHFARLFGRISASLGQPPIKQGIGSNLSRLSLVPSIGSSLASSKASLRDFKSLAKLVKERMVGPPSIATRTSYSSASSRRMSWVSQLSDQLGRASIREEEETKPPCYALESDNMVEE